MNLKKLLSTIGIISATITGSLNIVACNNTKSINSNEKSNNIKKSSQETNKIIEENKINETNTIEENKEIKKEISIPIPPPLPPLTIPVITKNIPLQEENKRPKREIKKISFDEEIKTATAKINKKIQINEEKHLKNNAVIQELKKETIKYSIPFAKGIDNKESLYAKINNKFISCQLTEELKNYFNESEFNFECINIFNKEWNSWVQIENSDLNTETVLKTKICFYYQKQPYQAELDINIMPAEKYIVEKISEYPYNIKISSKSTITDIKKQITNLIPTKILDEKSKNYLIENINKLIIKNEIFNKDKKEQALNDLLKETSPFKAIINFSFNDVEAELPLVITIIGPENISYVLNQTSNKILNSDIQNITTVKKGTNLDTFKTNLTSNVKEYYENSEIANIFNPEDFKITSISKIKKIENEKIKIKELKAKDFNNFQEIELQINYKYAKNDGKFMLILTIVPDVEDINSAIKNTNYNKKIANSTSVEELKNSIDDNFIKTSLQLNIQKYFNAKKFMIKEITNNNNNPITKEDLIANTTLYINYSYDDIEEKTILTLKQEKQNKHTPNKEYKDELKEILKKRREAIAPKED